LIEGGAIVPAPAVLGERSTRYKYKFDGLTYWPRKFDHPTVHAASGTCFSGKTCFVTKYIPPDVGYAETSSATTSLSIFAIGTNPQVNSLDKAIQRAKNEPENQHQMAVAGPPAANGEDHVAETMKVRSQTAW
jgi:hypothetical protein